jgi:hypothetical protein
MVKRKLCGPKKASLRSSGGGVHHTSYRTQLMATHDQCIDFRGPSRRVCTSESLRFSRARPYYSHTDGESLVASDALLHGTGRYGACQKGRPRISRDIKEGPSVACPPSTVAHGSQTSITIHARSIVMLRGRRRRTSRSKKKSINRGTLLNNSTTEKKWWHCRDVLRVEKNNLVT